VGGWGGWGGGGVIVWERRDWEGRWCRVRCEEGAGGFQVCFLGVAAYGFDGNGGSGELGLFEYRFVHRLYVGCHPIGVGSRGVISVPWVWLLGLGGSCAVCAYTYFFSCFS
jgi:hypothetical protein